MSGKRCLIVGGVIGLLAVVFGAFGAHGIEEAIPNWYTVADLKKPDEGDKKTERTLELDGTEPIEGRTTDNKQVIEYVTVNTKISHQVFLFAIN